MSSEPVGLAACADDESPSWWDRAACRDAGSKAFYGERDSFSAQTGPPDPEAIRFCSRCAVSDECLAFALNNNERHGIWGGMTPHQRTSLKRRMGRNGINPGAWTAALLAGPH